MGRQPTTGLTWADLQRYPDDGVRRELIDGELVVTPSPVYRHQRAVLRIGAHLLGVVEPQGGAVAVAPLDVVLDRSNIVQPDVLVFVAGRTDRIRDGYPRAAPDLAVEVSSPTTKGYDRVRKRALYERFGVRELWIVDLDDDVLEAYQLRDGRYDAPARYSRGDTVISGVVPGVSVAYDVLVPPAGPA